MDDGQKPNLSLKPTPDAGASQFRERSPMERFLWFLAAMSTLTALVMAVMLIVVLLQMSDGFVGEVSPDVATLRQAAMELEEKGLDIQAAESWREYLEGAGEIPDRAELLYRVGKLYMKTEQYGDAALFFVRAETAAKADGDDALIEKIGPKLVACLEKMGRPGEANRELSRRVEVGAEEKTGAILATIGGDEIRESDVETMARRYVDRMLATQGLPSDSAARADVERRLSSPAMQARILQEKIQMELLARKAREMGLHDDPEYLERRRQATEGLLQQFLLTKEFEKIAPSKSDLENYFKAHAERYGKPESIEVLLVQLEKDENAEEALGKIKSADDFHKWAEERKKAGSEGVAQTALRKAAEMPSALAAVFDLAEGEWTRTPIALGPGRLALLVEKKVAAQPQTFTEAESSVRRDYIGEKQQEMLGRLMSDLMRQYDVRILGSSTAPAFSGMSGLSGQDATAPTLKPVPGANIPARVLQETETPVKKEASEPTKPSAEKAVLDKEEDHTESKAPEAEAPKPQDEQPKENES